MQKLSFYVLFISTFFLPNLNVFAQSKTENEQRKRDSIYFLEERKNNNQLANKFYSVLANSNTSAKRQTKTVYTPSRILTPEKLLCPDTSERFFLRNSEYYLYPYDPVFSRSGDLIFSGEFLKKDQQNKNGCMIIRSSLDGQVSWVKLYDSANNVLSLFSYLYKAIELSDGSILAVGKTSNDATGNMDLLLMKLSSSGDIVWNKTYKSRFWTHGSGSMDYFYVQQIKQDPYTGDVFFSGPFWTNGPCIVKIDPSNGNIIWGKSYEIRGGVFDRPFGFDIKKNEIVFFGRRGTMLTIYRVNKLTGDTISTKFLSSNDINGLKVDFLTAEDLVVKNDGGYIISGRSYGYYEYNWDGTTPLFHTSVAEFDSSLNFIKAYNIRNTYYNNTYNIKTTIFPDGSGLFWMIHSYSGYTADAYIVQFNNQQITKQRIRKYIGEGMPFENPAIRLPDGGDLVVKTLGDSAANEGKIEFLKLHTSDTSSACLGVDDHSTFFYPFSFIPVQSILDSVKADPFQESVKKTFTTSQINLTKEAGCFVVSSCDSLAISARDSTICFGDSLFVSVYKNKACGTTIPFGYDTSVIKSFDYINDSTVAFTFNKPWKGYITASLQSCIVLKDSIFISVLKAPTSLSLGKDTSLCPQNQFVLNAKDGYIKYKWQDGSTDSTFTVTRPGKYYVTTEDACGNSYSDTINISAAPPVPLNLGQDRTKCNNDTLVINAPSGFINYSWGPNYNISSLSQQNIVVNPLKDTLYYLKAERTPGCFGFDTIKINVNRSPVINLGNDTSLCKGDSINLNAGTGFATYSWNTGNNTQQISVKTKGQYSVTGITMQGCKSYDTLSVFNIYETPVVHLNKDTAICFGSSKTLDAGNFNSYLWNNGNTSKSISVNQTGTYWVNVKDFNGCKGTDTSIIKKINSLPTAFLPADTSICSYDKLDLKTTISFEKYLWSTSQTSAIITISKSGSYWLTVTDKNNCAGTDSIVVVPKQCMTGFFMPTAFTPDGNGLNDDIKPFLFGNVVRYKFSIFNRWGQLVFETNNLSDGWNGSFKGLLQDPGVYTWSCVFQLESEEPQQKKGSLTLIR